MKYKTKRHYCPGCCWCLFERDQDGEENDDSDDDRCHKNNPMNRHKNNPVNRHKNNPENHHKNNQ